jgi:hypothetical protein
MTTRIRTFVTSEDAFVTVELVVMLAGGVVLGLASMALLSGGIEDLSGELQGSLVTLDPGTSGFMPLVTVTEDIIAD